MPIAKLDLANVRPGWMIGVRELRRLNRDEALRLAKAKGMDLPNQRAFSLAEPYCGRTKTARVCQQQRSEFAEIPAQNAIPLAALQPARLSAVE